MQNRRILVTGGPGAGKTTLLAALAARGHTHVPESARAVIQDRKRRGLSARPDPAEFAFEILRIDIERYRAATADAGAMFFDRGIPDALGMLDPLHLLTPADLGRYLADFPYARRAIILPPWKEIYGTDSERDQTFEESVRVYHALADWYPRCGYELFELPRVPTAERCRLVLQAFALS